MRIYFICIILLILPYVLVKSQPVHNQEPHNVEPENSFANTHQQLPNAQIIPKSEESANHGEQIISVRITSSVAVGRTKSKPTYKIPAKNDNHNENEFLTTISPRDLAQTYASTTEADIITSTIQSTILEDLETATEIPPNLIGANIEYIKQLQAKKGIRGLNHYERLHPYHIEDDQSYSNQANDSVAESSVHTVVENDELIEDVPLARSVPLSYSSKNFIQDPPPGHPSSSRLTTVNFNVVHDAPKELKYNNEQLPAYVNVNQNGKPDLNKFYNQPSKVYSQPAQVYSEPAKFYSEPAKIYSEPAKIYSEPAKIYSEPAKIYSEPAKFYSQPASLHLSPDDLSDQVNWRKQSATSTYSSTVISTTSPSITNPPHPSNQRVLEQQPEKNYEIDEKVSVMTDGRTHGEQPPGQENCKQENCKVGYVVEGRQFRKYRVEERTPDGFIVGEYGVVRNEDGALRGVRYTADSDASPRLIHDALMKFLQLK